MAPFQRGLYNDKAATPAPFQITGNNLSSLNSQIPSLRHMPEGQLASIWRKAYREDPVLALRWLFYLRDCRGGVGERQTFRRILPLLNPSLLVALIKTRVPIDGSNPSIPLIPYYGRWDDLIELFDIRSDNVDSEIKKSIKKAVVEVLHEQLMMDIKGMMEHKPISLMAKWIPTMSANNSRKSSMSFRLAERLGFKEPNLYQSTISELRGYLKIVERDMSARKWDQIDYSGVPNKASMIYSSAFERHDEQRFQRYILKRKNEGSDVDPFILPYGIYQRMRKAETPDECILLREKWDNVEGDLETERNMIVIPDVSDSMMKSRLSEKSAVTCVDLSLSTAILMADKNTSKVFHGTAVVFSDSPEIFDVELVSPVGSRVRSGTVDLEQALEKILQYAVQRRCPLGDIPEDVLIISDTDFSTVVRAGSGQFTGERRAVMKKKFEAKGYLLPRIIFWNSNPTAVSTIQDNGSGIVYVTGFNRFLYQAIVSGKLNYSKFLVETLSNPRYDFIEEVFRSAKDGWSIKRQKDSPQPQERKKLLPHEKALKILEQGPKEPKKQSTDTRRKRRVQKYSKGGHPNEQQHARQKGRRNRRP